MGSSFTNCHVRCPEATRCATAVGELTRRRAILTSPKKRWITVYDEACESQNIAELARFAKGLSSKLSTDVITFLLHDSDVFIYQAYRKGRLVDQFNSRPDYFGEISAAEQKQWAGNFKKLLPLAPAGVTVEKIAKVLGKKHLFQEQLVAAFARLMGIDAKRACTGFGYLEQSSHKFRMVHGRGHSPEAAALIKSVDRGDLEKVHLLLSKGVSPDVKSRMGESLLASAIRFNKREIAFALLDAGADPFSPQETNAIWAAAAHGQREVLARLLQLPSPKLQACFPSALTSAVQMGHAEIAGDLLKAGANPNTANKDGFTLLMTACFRGLEVIWEITFGREIPSRPGEKARDWTAIVTALVNAGADVNARAGNGMTALMLAQLTGQKEIVDILERAGADAAVTPSHAEIERLMDAYRKQVGETQNQMNRSPGPRNRRPNRFRVNCILIRKCGASFCNS